MVTSTHNKVVLQKSSEYNKTSRFYMKLLLVFALCLYMPSAICSQHYASYVYICTGRMAYSYHQKRDCRGLNRCKGDIKKVSIGYAKSINRKPCRICY